MAARAAGMKMPASCTVCLYCKSFKYRLSASVGSRRSCGISRKRMQRYALFPEHANFSGIFFKKKTFFMLSLIFVKRGERAHIFLYYIYAGRKGRASPAAELRGTGPGRRGRRGRRGGQEGKGTVTDGKGGRAKKYHREGMERGR